MQRYVERASSFWTSEMYRAPKEVSENLLPEKDTFNKYYISQMELEQKGPLKVLVQ